MQKSHLCRKKKIVTFLLKHICFLETVITYPVIEPGIFFFLDVMEKQMVLLSISIPFGKLSM